MTITLWGRNILDKKVPIWVNGFGSIIPVSPSPAGYTGSIYEGWLEPRRYGVSLAYQF
jgi:outer membrane receptor protein involved in Fe transport